MTKSFAKIANAKNKIGENMLLVTVLVLGVLFLCHLQYFSYFSFLALSHF